LSTQRGTATLLFTGPAAIFRVKTGHMRRMDTTFCIILIN
jgi:hypothetical protein